LAQLEPVPLERALLKLLRLLAIDAECQFLHHIASTCS